MIDRVAFMEWQLGIHDAAGDFVQPEMPPLYTDHQMSEIAISRLKYTQAGVLTPALRDALHHSFVFNITCPVCGDKGVHRYRLEDL